MNNEELNQIPVQPVEPTTPVVPNPEPEVQPVEVEPSPVEIPAMPEVPVEPTVPAEPVAPVVPEVPTVEVEPEKVVVPPTPVVPETPKIVPNTQINPTAPIADATAIPDVDTDTSSLKAESPIIAPTKVEEVKEPVVTASVTNEDISDVASTTFDYNALYGVQKSEEELAKEEQLDVVDKPMFTASEIVIDSPSITNRTSEDIVPEFNINALDENANTTGKTTDSAMNDDEKDKAETRRAVIWLVVLALLLLVFVGFVFPTMTK